MKTWKSNPSWLVAIVLATCVASSSAMAQTQDAKSSQSLEYEQAHQRGTQAVIWGLPAVSMKFFFEGMQAVGAGYNDIVYFSKPMVSRHLFRSNGPQGNGVKLGPDR